MVRLSTVRTDAYGVSLEQFRKIVRPGRLEKIGAFYGGGKYGKERQVNNEQPIVEYFECSYLPAIIAINVKTQCVIRVYELVTPFCSDIDTVKAYCNKF